MLAVLTLASSSGLYVDLRWAAARSDRPPDAPFGPLEALLRASTRRRLGVLAGRSDSVRARSARGARGAPARRVLSVTPDARRVGGAYRHRSAVVRRAGLPGHDRGCPHRRKAKPRWARVTTFSRSTLPGDCRSSATGMARAKVAPRARTNTRPSGGGRKFERRSGALAHAHDDLERTRSPPATAAVAFWSPSRPPSGAHAHPRVSRLSLSSSRSHPAARSRCCRAARSQRPYPQVHGRSRPRPVAERALIACRGGRSAHRPRSRRTELHIGSGCGQLDVWSGGPACSRREVR